MERGCGGRMRRGAGRHRRSNAVKVGGKSQRGGGTGMWKNEKGKKHRGWQERRRALLAFPAVSFLRENQTAGRGLPKG